MAFKKKALREETQDDPYHIDDLLLEREFKTRPLHRDTVTVGLASNTITPGLRDIEVPADAGRQTIHLILKRQRARDYRETVQEILFQERRKILDQKNFRDLEAADFDRADAVSRDIIVEGFWEKRWWKTQDGDWRSTFDLHVVRFHYQSDPDRGIWKVMGRTPAFV